MVEKNCLHGMMEARRSARKESTFIMGAHLNPLEKEVLIRRYLSNPNVDINLFCEVNNVSITAFKNWLKKYNEQGIEGLVSKRKGEEMLGLMPEGMDPTNENLKRELMKARIEIERFKKNYTVETTPDGDTVFRRLKEKNTKS